MRKKTKQIVPLSSAAAIWRPSSAQSVTPDVWPKNRKHEPTVRLEEQGREVARSTSLPYAMEDFCLQAGSNKTNVCLYSRKSSTLTVSWHSILIKSSCHLLCWRKCFRSLCGLSSARWYEEEHNEHVLPPRFTKSVASLTTDDKKGSSVSWCFCYLVSGNKSVIFFFLHLIVWHVNVFF